MRLHGGEACDSYPTSVSEIGHTILSYVSCLNDLKFTFQVFARSFSNSWETYIEEHARPNMYKSGVVDAENGGSSFSNIRTSTGSFIPIGKETD